MNLQEIKNRAREEFGKSAVWSEIDIKGNLHIAPEKLWPFMYSLLDELVEAIREEIVWNSRKKSQFENLDQAEGWQTRDDEVIEALSRFKGEDNLCVVNECSNSRELYAVDEHSDVESKYCAFHGESQEGWEDAKSKGEEKSV